MNLIFLGPQGSGKGTQAELLVQKYGLHYFEAGKVLRSIANSDNPNAAMIKNVLHTGGLVPDEFVKLIAWDFITKHDLTKGLVFDGYPRSLPQYAMLQDMLRRKGHKIDWVINITISADETIRRLSARRTCSKCGEIYNLITHPPVDGKCQCGGELVQRDDDQPDAIARRLAIYKAQTQPVFDQAVAEGVGIKIDGERPIDQIHQDIISKLHL